MSKIEKPENNLEKQEKVSNDTKGHYKELLMNILNSINPENHQNNLENTANFNSQVIDLESSENLDLSNVNTILNSINDQEIAILWTKTQGNYLQIIRNWDKFELQYFINWQSFWSKELVDNLNISYPDNNWFKFAEINYNWNHYWNIKEAIIYTKVVKNTPIIQENQIIEDESTQEPILWVEDFKKLLENSKIWDRVEVGDYSYIKWYGVWKKLNKWQSLAAEKNYIKLVDSQEIIDEFYSFYNIEKSELSKTITAEPEVVAQAEVVIEPKVLQTKTSTSTLKQNVDKNENFSKEVSIWDLNWSYEALIWNLEYAWLIDKNKNWIWWDTRLIFHWDIIWDRCTNSLKALSKIVQLREQAKSVWWKIIYLLWNHDSFAFEFLWEYPVKWHKSSKGNKLKNWITDYQDQAIWLIEFQTNFWKRKKVHTRSFLWVKSLDVEKFESWSDILDNMRHDSNWIKILEAMCDYDIFVFDKKTWTLYTHTPINQFTAEQMVSEWVENFVDKMNVNFKASAKRVLFWSSKKTLLERMKYKVSSFFWVKNKKDQSDDLKINWLTLQEAKENLRFIWEKICNTGNKFNQVWNLKAIDPWNKIYYDLNNSWVKKIVHWHEGYSNDHWPIKTISVDTWYGNPSRKYLAIPPSPAVYVNKTDE